MCTINIQKKAQKRKAHNSAAKQAAPFVSKGRQAAAFTLLALLIVVTPGVRAEDDPPERGRLLFDASDLGLPEPDQPDAQAEARQREEAFRERAAKEWREQVQKGRAIACYRIAEVAAKKAYRDERKSDGHVHMKYLEEIEKALSLLQNYCTERQ